MNKAPVNFLMHIFNGDINSCARIATADAVEDKETIKKITDIDKIEI